MPKLGCCDIAVPPAPTSYASALCLLTLRLALESKTKSLLNRLKEKRAKDTIKEVGRKPVEKSYDDCLATPMAISEAEMGTGTMSPMASTCFATGLAPTHQTPNEL